MPRQALAPDSPCVCGHVYEAHRHFRRGTDCALCDCPKFRLDKAAARR